MSQLFITEEDYLRTHAKEKSQSTGMHFKMDLSVPIRASAHRGVEMRP